MGAENDKSSYAEAAKNAAKDAAAHLMGDAEKDFQEIRKQGILGFFSFDKMYFPIIARYVFIVICVFSVIGMVVGFLSGLVELFTGGLLAGPSIMITSILFGLLGIFGTRIWFELIMLGFKINENLEKIRDK